MSDARQELATIFKRNRRLAELNPDLCAEVLVGKNLAIRGDLSHARTKQGKATFGCSAPAEPQAVLKAPIKKRKYRNDIVVVDNVRFDSKKEAARHGDLVLLEKAGEIRSLTRQRTFSLEVNKVKICDYRCDFEYFELDRATGVWTWIVEDVKSEVTRKLPAYRYKKRLMLAIWRVNIRET